MWLSHLWVQSEGQVRSRIVICEIECKDSGQPQNEIPNTKQLLSYYYLTNLVQATCKMQNAGYGNNAIELGG